MPAIAITDHGNMHGPTTSTGRPPTPGSSRSSASRPMSPRLRKPEEAGALGRAAPEERRRLRRWRLHPQDDLGEERQGLHNLFKLSSRAYTEGFVRKWARMDVEILAEHSEGLMATTGCPSGEVQTRLRLGQYDEALEAAAKYQELFGKDNYFLEIMDHGLDIERRVRDGLTEISKRARHPAAGHQRLPLHPRVARRPPTTRCCASRPASSSPTPTGSGSTARGYYIKSADEMRAVDTSDLWAEGCRNTLLVAEKVDPTGMFEFRNLMPTLPGPRGRDRGVVVPQGGLAGHGPPVPRRRRRGAPQAGRVRDGRHLPDGVPLLLPRRRRLHHVGEEQRHRGRPGPWLGGRLAGRVRAWASPTSTRCRTA